MRGIWAVAFDEASEEMLAARKKLLRTDVAISLRQRLWLGINRELTSNPRTWVNVNIHGDGDRL